MTVNRNQIMYNNPAWTVIGGKLQQTNKSSIGEQHTLNMYIKAALEDAVKEQYFTQMASTIGMAKHMGKEIVQSVYVPLLDDRNINSQGIDANGKILDATTGEYGNLYGSSKDVGTMTSKMPILSETGGRVNRVGFTRKLIRSSFHKFGFFYEFTQEALDFDTDASLLEHMSKEAIRGANEITEDMLGMELLYAAGVRHYAGKATSMATITANTAGEESIISYKTLQRLAIELKENRAPNRLSAITGSRIVDSKIIGSGYALYIGYPLENHFRDMEQFIPVEKYAGAHTPLTGEIGTVGQFRIVVVPEMPEFNAEGATATGAAQLAKYRSSSKTITDFDALWGEKTGADGTAAEDWREGGISGDFEFQGWSQASAKAATAGTRWDVFPCLAVASEAFTVIGFQTGANTGAKFKMITKMPGEATADYNDPYGETGFTSIKWFHGLLVRRPEWIAVALTVAPL